MQGQDWGNFWKSLCQAQTKPSEILKSIKSEIQVTFITPYAGRTPASQEKTHLDDMTSEEKWYADSNSIFINAHQSASCENDVGGLD
jgi:hypothetical protein